MQFVCDAPNRAAWFRIETEGEAQIESEEMRHAVEKYFRREHEAARQSYRPNDGAFIERDIGLNTHVQKTMPLFLTLRDRHGAALATAMLPPCGKESGAFRTIIVGPSNGDPFGTHAEAIAALGQHFALNLTRERCYPYQHYGV